MKCCQESFVTEVFMVGPRKEFTEGGCSALVLPTE